MPNLSHGHHSFINRIAKYMYFQTLHTLCLLSALRMSCQHSANNGSRDRVLEKVTMDAIIIKVFKSNLQNSPVIYYVQFKRSMKIVNMVYVQRFEVNGYI